jgi:hypothetical protein
MKNKMDYKKISIVTAAVLLCHTAAHASEVRLVSAEEEPRFSIFSLFKGKSAAPTENARQEDGDTSSIETAVTQNAAAFTALDGSLSVIKNTPKQGALNGTVPGTAAVTFAIETPPEKGAVTISNAATGDFVYTPFTDAAGADAFVFSAVSGDYGKQTATVSVTIAEGEQSVPPPSPPSRAFRYEDMLGHWGETSAVKLAEDNILTGYKIGKKYFFYPEAELTRGDFILYLVSALAIDVSAYAEIASPFADAAATPAWMNLQAKAAYDAGIIKGSLEGDALYLNADEKITRLEAVAMLNNTIKPRVVSVGEAEYTDMYLVPAWGVVYIQNMTAYGLLDGYADGTVRPYAKITRAMSAEMLNQTLKYKAEHPEVMTELKAEMDKKMDY